MTLPRDQEVVAGGMDRKLSKTVEMTYGKNHVSGSNLLSEDFPL